MPYLIFIGLLAGFALLACGAWWVAGFFVQPPKQPTSVGSKSHDQH
jgi:hypothetical protein